MKASEDLEIVFQLFCDHQTKTWKYVKCDHVPEKFIVKALQVAIDHYNNAETSTKTTPDQPNT
ncbi:MAG: hypothetical protein ACR2PH_02175 [Desulfobulbia bacterium]